MEIEILIILGVMVAALILFGLGLNYLPTQDYAISPSTEALIQPAVQKQQKLEAEIEAYYRGGKFTFDNPLVVQNPYGTAPLTALLIFDTPEATQISIHVPGKTPLAAVDFTFDGFNKHHEIPVYGLYADYLNQVTLTGKNQAGDVTTTVVPLQTEPLPVSLDWVSIVQVNPALYNPGMNFTFQNNKIVFDINGEVRWFDTQSTLQTFVRLENGHYLFTYSVPNEPNDVLMEQDLLGKIYAIYNVPNGVQHDYTELPDGNLLVTSNDDAAYMQEDFLIEIDRQSGHIVRSFDLKNYLDQSRPAEIDSDPGDWLHLNSVVYDANDQSIIISSRSQSAVIKLSYPDMKIQWILGPHDNWPTKLQPYLLTPEGNNFEWQWSQHDATILSEKTINGSQIIDILLFDNGNYRSFDPNMALSPENSYSRMVVYQINETNQTVEQVWEYGKERGSEIFSTSRGSAYLLGNGDFLGTWAEIDKDQNGVAVMEPVTSGTTLSKIIEVDPVNNQVVFEANLHISTDYRTFRANLYDGYSEENSNLSVKLNDTTVFNLGERVITALQPVKKKSDKIQLWLKGAAKKALKRLGIPE